MHTWVNVQKKLDANARPANSVVPKTTPDESVHHAHGHVPDLV